MKEKKSCKAKCKKRPSCFSFCYKSSVMPITGDEDGGTSNQTVSSRRRRKAKSLPDDQAENIISASSEESVAQASKNKARHNGIRSSQPGSFEPSPTGTSDSWVKSLSSWANKLDQMGVGLPFPILMLAVMAIYGIVASVVLMITCLLVVGLLRQPPHAREDVGKGDGGKGRTAAGEVDVESEQYKKRVVLEGLLERKSPRTPVRARP